MEWHKIAQELKADFNIISQGKSDFVLEYLVVGQEDTLPQQWVQCLLELKARYFSIANLILDIKEARQRHRRHKLIETVTLGLFGNARRQELQVESLQLSIDGIYAEFHTLYRLYKSMPKFSREQIEAGQYEYWKTRLTKQGYFDVLATGRVQAGNLEGLRQINTSPDYSKAGQVSFDYRPLPTIEEKFKELLKADNDQST